MTAAKQPEPIFIREDSFSREYGDGYIPKATARVSPARPSKAHASWPPGLSSVIEAREPYITSHPGWTEANYLTAGEDLDGDRTTGANPLARMQQLDAVMLGDPEASLGQL